MAQQFNLTAQINLQSPKNVGRVVSDIQRQLKGSGLNTVNIKVKADPRSMAQTNRQLQNVSKNSRAAAKDISNLNRNLQEATRRFSVITIATGTLLSLVTGFKNATKAAIEFERELLKISQVTGKSVQQLQGLTKEVTRLSTSFGVSSADLLNVSRTLAQAGFNAEKTRKALDILAKTTLAATFDNIQDTTEGAIALLRQFGAEAKRSGGDIAFLEKSLDAINAVSKKFAVESGDLITVIRRVGGVFSAAGGSINELIALFTSVRATTRESAETIATGLRTIFTRIQRTDTIQQLKALNIELQDSQGRFVGAFEAVKRLSQGLSVLDPKDFRFSQIVEELGGFRQIGKVIPLIQQFATAQQALTVAQNASGSTARDAAIAQQGLGNQIAKVREEFTALIRKFTDSGPFNSIATGALKIASAMIKVAEAVEPLLPLLTTMFGLKLGRALAPGLGQLAGITRGASRTGGGGFSKFARGGMVPGSGNRDTVPAMLTPGEFVIKKSSVKKLGAGTLAQMNQNRYAKGGNVADINGRFGYNFVDDTSSIKGSFSDTKIPVSMLDGLAQSKLSSDIGGNVNRFVRKGSGLSAAEAKAVENFINGSGPVSAGQKSSLVAAGLAPSQKEAAKLNRNQVKRQLIKQKRLISGFEEGSTLIASGGSAAGLLPSASKIFDKHIDQQLPKLFTKAVGKFDPPLGSGEDIPLNKLISESAINSIRGQFFEVFVRRATNQEIKETKKDPLFDFKTGDPAGFKALFGSSIFPSEFKINNSRENIASAYGKAIKEGLSIRKLASGGGISGSDTVPALLTPGEFVFNKGAAQSIGYGNLKRMNEQGVQGFANGGPVGSANGGPVNQISSAGSAADILKAAEDEIDARKKSTAEMTKNTAEEKKNTNESKKDTQGLKKHSDILSKSKDKISQFASKIQSGAASVQRIASSAQNFVFLGASIGAVTSQMSSLEDTTKQAINETAGFAAGIVGIGATVVDVFSSIITSAAAQRFSSESVVRGNTEHVVSSKAVVTANKTQAASSGIFGTALAGITTGVLVGVTALKYFSAKSKATADKIEKGIDEALAGVAEGRSADAAALTKAAQEEIEQRKRSAAQYSFGAATAVTSFAIAGAAIGSVVGPAGTFAGILAGGLVGGALGAAAALGLVELGAYGEIEARKAELDAIHKSIQGIISLTSSIYEFETALAAVDSVAGLSDKDRLERRNLALDNAPGLSFNTVATQSEEARGQLLNLAASRGKSVDALTEQDFENNADAAQQFKFATDLMEKSAKAAEVRFKATSKTFQLAMQTANPSKTFEELSTQSGPYKDALDAQIASIRLMTGIQIAAAQDQLNMLKATGANQKAIDSQQKTVDSLKKSQDDLIKNTLDGAEAAQKVANAQYEAARRTREASIALARSLIESGQFFDGLNKQLQALQGEALAIDNFNAALDGAVFKFKEINIDEIDNLTNVRDLNTFAKQLGDAAKGAGPEAQKYVDQLTANAAAFKRAQEGGLLGLELGLSKDAGGAQTEKILKDLGFSADTLGGGELGQKIFEEMQSQLTKALEDGVVDATELEAILGPAEKANAQAVDAAKKLVEIRQQEITNLQANLAAQEKLRQKEIEIREAQIDAIRKGVGRTEKAQEILAKSIDPRAEFTPQRGVETRLQNINAQNRLDTLGIGLQAGDIGGVTQARRNAQQRQEQIRKEIEAGGLTTEQTKALVEEQDRLAKIINTTGDELKRLSDRSSEAADIQGAMEQNLRAIEEERKAREQVTGVIEDFVVGGVEARRGLVEAATGVRQAFASGTLQMQTPEQRRATVGLLDRLSDVQLAGGMTGRQIKQELVFRDAVRLGLDPELAQAIATGTSTEEKLIDANRDLAQKMEQLTVATLLASQGLGNPFAAAALATGGMVQYRAGGGTIFKPKGTDTVPAMLTPGEFVIRKSAVDAIGADTLAAINEGGVAYRSNGSKDKERKKYDGYRSVDIKGNTRFGITDKYADVDRSGIPQSHRDFEKGGLQLENTLAPAMQEFSVDAKTARNRLTGGRFGQGFTGLFAEKASDPFSEANLKEFNFVAGAAAEMTADTLAEAPYFVVKSLYGKAAEAVQAGFEDERRTKFSEAIQERNVREAQRQMEEDKSRAAQQREKNNRRLNYLNELYKSDRTYEFLSLEDAERYHKSRTQKERDAQSKAAQEARDANNKEIEKNKKIVDKFKYKDQTPSATDPSQSILRKESENKAKAFMMMTGYMIKQNTTEIPQEQLDKYLADSQADSSGFYSEYKNAQKAVQQQFNENAAKRAAQADKKLSEDLSHGAAILTGEYVKGKVFDRQLMTDEEFRKKYGEERFPETEQFKKDIAQLKSSAENSAATYTDRQLEAMARSGDGVDAIGQFGLDMKFDNEGVLVAGDAPDIPAAQKKPEPIFYSEDAKKRYDEQQARKNALYTDEKGRTFKNKKAAEDYYKRENEKPKIYKDPKTGAIYGSYEIYQAHEAKRASKQTPVVVDGVTYGSQAVYERHMAKKAEKEAKKRKVRVETTVGPSQQVGTAAAPVAPGPLSGFEGLEDYRPPTSPAVGIPLPIDTSGAGPTEEELVADLMASDPTKAASDRKAARLAMTPEQRQAKRDQMQAEKDLKREEYFAKQDKAKFKRKRDERRADIRKRRGIIPRSQRGTPAQLARRAANLPEDLRADFGPTEEQSNLLLKNQYERILRTQGPAAAQRFARTFGYEPPVPRGRFTRGRGRSQQAGASTTDQLLQQLLQQMLRQGGGNRGGITPRRFAAGGSAGSADVIPAMLTPGEFVMSAGAVRQHGVGAMRALNRGQVPGFNRGGMVGGVAYRNLGSSNAETVGSRSAFTIDTEGLDVFQQTFDKTVQGIASSLKGVSDKLGHFEMSHTFSGEVGLNVTGVNIDPKIIADQFSAAFTDMVKTEIEQAFVNRSNNVQTPGQG